MGAKKKTTQTNTEEVQVTTPSPAVTETIDQETAPGAETEEKVTKKKISRGRSKKYTAVRAKVDKTKKYDPFAAVELVKKLSYSRFEGTLSAHVVVKETGMSMPLTLPHSTGKALRVAIASDDVLKEIEAGNMNFDVLIATPAYMGKLAKFAPVLGPKGLMPNPKNGTLTPNPEAQKKKLEAGTVTVKTEKKAPLMHIRLGKASMDTKKLVENLEAVIKAVGPKMDRLTIAATMSPGIKVETSVAAA